MKKTRLSVSIFMAAASLLAGTFLSVAATASPILFDRGLPTANLNHAAGANRSNVAWGDAGTTVSIGDNFSLAYSSVIDQVRVWVVSRTQAAPAANAFTLSLGNDAGAASTVSPVASSTSVTSTTYSGGSSYQATNGDFIYMFQIDFAGLSLAVGPGTFAFSISGPPGAAGLSTPFLHASNGPLSGSTQTGSDSIMYGFTALGAMDIANGWPFNSFGNGWDKSSDFNVQVYGTVPEPSTFALIAMALLSLFGFGMMRRRGSI